MVRWLSGLSRLGSGHSGPEYRVEKDKGGVIGPAGDTKR